MKYLLGFFARILLVAGSIAGWVMLFGFLWSYFHYVKPMYDEADAIRARFEQAVASGADLPALQRRFAPPADADKKQAAPDIALLPSRGPDGQPRYVMRWQRTAGPLVMAGVVFHFSAIAPNPASLYADDNPAQ